MHDGQKLPLIDLRLAPYLSVFYALMIIYASAATTASSNHGLFGTKIELFDQFYGAEVPIRALVGLFGFDKGISLPESLLCLLFHSSKHLHALVIEQSLLSLLGIG